MKTVVITEGRKEKLDKRYRKDLVKNYEFKHYVKSGEYRCEPEWEGYYQTIVVKDGRLYSCFNRWYKSSQIGTIPIYSWKYDGWGGYEVIMFRYIHKSELESIIGSDLDAIDTIDNFIK